jgi:hypothetical protein
MNWKDVEGSSYGIIYVIFQYLLGENEYNYKRTHQDKLCLRLDANWAVQDTSQKCYRMSQLGKA